MKTYRNTNYYLLFINLSYTAVHYVILSDLLHWKMVNYYLYPKAAGFCTYFYSVGRAFDFIRSKYGLITCLMTHYGMTFASSVAIGGFIIM